MKISALLRKGTERIRKCWVNRAPEDGECCAATAVNVGSFVSERVKAREYLRNELPPGILGLFDWNDHPQRKKAEVIALFKKATAAALRDEAKDVK